MIRAVILAATIAALITMWSERLSPAPVHTHSTCWQPVWNVWQEVIGGYFTSCSKLDRYENA